MEAAARTTEAWFCGAAATTNGSSPRRQCKTKFWEVRLQRTAGKSYKKSMEKYMLPCLNKMIFGFDCPGCGMQRALKLLVEGDFGGAFRMYPPVYTGVAFMLSALLMLADRRRNYSKLVIALAIVNAVVILISYFYKLVNQNIIL